MKLDLLETRIQNMLESVTSAAKTAEYLADKMRTDNDICSAGIIGISAQARNILDKCERMKAICDALTYEEKEGDDDSAT